MLRALASRESITQGMNGFASFLSSLFLKCSFQLDPRTILLIHASDLFEKNRALEVETIAIAFA